jgi:hypothetical protein
MEIDHREVSNYRDASNNKMLHYSLLADFLVIIT